MRPKSRETNGSPEWTHVTFAESDSTPGEEYAIDRRVDGAWRCECLSFRFCKGRIGSGKSCKHLRAWLGVEGAASTIEAVTVKATTETFTFRRAMRFGSTL